MPPTDRRGAPAPGGGTTLASAHPFEVAFLRLIHLPPAPPPALAPDAWDAVLALAVREQMAPLARNGVRLAGADIPPSVRAGLDRSAGEAGSRGAAAYAQVADLAGRLRAAGVPLVLLKGAALARFTYRDDALRPFADLDVLIPLDGVDAAHRALRGAGYAIIGDAPSAADRAWRHGRAYYDPTGERLPVDLHWRYLGYPLMVPLNYDGVLQRAREVVVEGGSARGPAPVLLPAPADLVVASAVAFLRDLWYGKPRLRYLRDVAEISRAHHVDWEFVQATARDVPLLRTPLALAITAAVRLIGAPVPDPALAALRPPGRMGSVLLRRVARLLLRRVHPVEAVVQVGAMRWLDGGGRAAREWVRSLLALPAPLAPGRRRWLRHLWQG